MAGLVEAVRASVILDWPDKSGETLRKRWRALERQGADCTKMLEMEGVRFDIDLEAEPPQGGDYLLDVFRAMRGGVAPGLECPGKMTFRDIESGCRLLGLSLAPWEVKALMAMDAGLIEAAAKAGKVYGDKH